MTKIPGLAAFPLNEPLGFSGLRPHTSEPHQPGCMCPKCGEQKATEPYPGKVFWIPDAAEQDRIIIRLRAALKAYGLTTEEIDSIATDQSDGVRVSQQISGTISYD